MCDRMAEDAESWANCSGVSQRLGNETFSGPHKQNGFRASVSVSAQFGLNLKFSFKRMSRTRNRTPSPEPEKIEKDVDAVLPCGYASEYGEW